MRIFKKLPVSSKRCEISSRKKNILKFKRLLLANTIPTQIIIFFQGIRNIIRWIPFLYKDKDWDDSYILKILQKKIEHQCKYLVKHNVHESTDIKNFWMTVVLNLIERVNAQYYFHEFSFSEEESTVLGFKTVKESYNYNTVKIIEEKKSINEFLEKHKSIVRKIKKANSPLSNNDKIRLAWSVCAENHERSRLLIYEIMKCQSTRWWD